MKKLGRQVRLYLLLDAIIILFCIPGIYHINQKADLPFSFVKNDRYLVVDRIRNFVTYLQKGDTLISIDGMRFGEREEIEIYLDSKSIGNNVSIVFFHDGKLHTAEVTLTGYYTLPFVISNSLVGILFILLGIFVLLKCPDLKAARLFHWGSIGIAVMLLYTWG